MNKNIQTNIINYSKEYGVMTYNVDQGMSNEKIPGESWNDRYPRILSLINDADNKFGHLHIICIQEIKNLPNTISVNEFLAKFKGYEYQKGYRNASLKTLNLATLWDPIFLYPIKIVTKWLSNTPDIVSDSWNEKGFGSIVLAIKFLQVKKEKIVMNSKAFWVMNVHFPIDEISKTKSCEKLIEITKELAGEDEFIICGDFNFFTDGDGERQRNYLSTYFNNLGKNAKSLEGKTLEHTYPGKSYHEFKIDPTKMISTLDHIFGSKNVKGSNPIIYTKTMKDPEPEELSTQDQPSDHFPLCLKIKLD